jgi:micrococcal nuclease
MSGAPDNIPYVYRATIIRWVDGDTVWLEIDLGFQFSAQLDFRLTGINTPERGKPGWTDANNRVRALAPIGSQVIIQSRKVADKYGRYMAHIWNMEGVHINQELLDNGLAVPFMVDR